MKHAQILKKIIKINYIIAIREQLCRITYLCWDGPFIKQINVTSRPEKKAASSKEGAEPNTHGGGQNNAFALLYTSSTFDPSRPS